MAVELGSPGLGLPYTYANFGLAEGLEAGLGVPVLGNYAVHIAEHQYSAELVAVAVAEANFPPKTGHKYLVVN